MIILSWTLTTFNFLQCNLPFKPELLLSQNAKVNPSSLPSKASTLVTINLLKIVKDLLKATLFFRFKLRKSSFWMLMFHILSRLKEQTSKTNKVEQEWLVEQNKNADLFVSHFYFKPNLVEETFILSWMEPRQACEFTAQFQYNHAGYVFPFGDSSVDLGQWRECGWRQLSFSCLFPHGQAAVSAHGSLETGQSTENVQMSFSLVYGLSAIRKMI